MRRVYPNGYTLFITQADLSSNLMGLSTEEMTATIRVALQDKNPPIVVDMVVAGINSKTFGERAQALRSILRDYFTSTGTSQISVALTGAQAVAPTPAVTTTTRGVPSETFSHVTYTLTYENGRVVSCTCPHFIHRQVTCKHMKQNPTY
jgi:hypothetical protein